MFSQITAPFANSKNLLGHSQVAPQLLITGGGLLSGQGSGLAPTAIPIQHLLIPVSTGNGTQQLISIPLSLAAGAGNQIQLLATSSGQLIATNLPGVSQTVNFSAPRKTSYLMYECIKMFVNKKIIQIHLRNYVGKRYYRVVLGKVGQTRQGKIKQ